MDLINEKKKYPQKVEVVNELKAKVETTENSPLFVDFPSSFVSSSGNQDRLRVSIANYDQLPILKPTTSTTYNLHISCINVVNSGIGYVFPLNLVVYNITASTVANNVSALYNTFSQRFMSATSIVIFYETISNTGAVNSVSYSADD